MFRNLKLATGIYATIGAFMAFFMAVIFFGLFVSVTMNENFERSVKASENTFAMQDAVTSVTRGILQVDTLMLRNLLNRGVTDEDTKVAKAYFEEAEKDMVYFMSIPFTSPVSEAAAKEVEKTFDTLLKTGREKIAYIKDPTSAPDSLAEEFANRMKLKNQVNDFIQITNRLSKEYVQQAKDEYRMINILTAVAVSVSVIVLILSHLWLKSALFKRLRQASDALKRIEKGDLSEPVLIGARNEIGELLLELENMRLALTGTVGGIRSGVERVYHNSHEIASGNSDLSSRTEQQASALQETAASMEELKITVRQNADNAHSARQLAENASTSARHGGDVMVNLDEIMRQIMESSRQIADINSVIDSIANQTNILALNAAVEAARAGEQGRGFAVVAGEVRNLAKRSADAAKESRELITTCVTNMNMGSQQVGKAGAAMQDIVKSVSQVTDIMAEIASASDEQSTGINQIAQAVNEMDLVTQQNAAMVEEASAAASNLESQAEQLEGMVSKFKINDTVSNKKGASGTLQNHALISPATAKNDAAISGRPTEEQWETF